MAKNDYLLFLMHNKLLINIFFIHYFSHTDAHYITCRIQECSETTRNGPFLHSIDTSSLVVQDEYIFIQVCLHILAYFLWKNCLPVIKMVPNWEIIYYYGKILFIKESRILAIFSKQNKPSLTKSDKGTVVFPVSNKETSIIFSKCLS